MQDDLTQPDPEPTDQFASDLGAIYRAQIPVPPQLDEAILADARRQLSPRRSNLRLIRISALVTAAAAMVVIAVHVYSPPGLQSAPQVAIQSPSNKQVDIVDALKLARRILAGDINASRDDFNHDGAVDQHDVDAIAMAAVRLPEGRVQ
jgi:hypothetical protein